MVSVESTLPLLLVILLLGLVIPELFKKLHLPFVTSLIIIGAVLGPNGLAFVQSDPVLEVFGFLGSSFLLLMAGLEAKLEHLKGLKESIGFMALVNGLVPFLVGLFITKAFGYSWLTSLLVGVVFVSSSITIVMASIRGAGLFKRKLGQTIISTTLLEDIASLILLAIILQNVAPVSNYPLPIYFGIVILSVVVLKMFLPELAKFYFRRKKREDHEGQLRFVLVVLIAVLIYFSGLGVHPIVAAFLVGLLISDTVKSEVLYAKLHTLGYGLFVPVFFFIVGMQLDFSVLRRFDFSDLVIPSLILGLLLSKFLSGYFAARMNKFSRRDAGVFGAATIPQLTTTLAATYAGATFGILDATLVTAILILAVVTTVLAPILVQSIANYKGGAHGA